MEFFLRNKTLILRTIGVLMLLVGFVMNFWIVPPQGLTENELAKANIARMEAQAKGTSLSSSNSAKKDDSKFLENLKNTQKKQLEYLTIFMMLFGGASLGVSFLKKRAS